MHREEIGGNDHMHLTYDFEEGAEEGKGRRQRRKTNKAEMDVFLELSCFFDDPADVGNLINVISSTVKIRTIHIKIKTMPQKKKCKKAKWLSEEALQTAEKRREAKRKGEKERYTCQNAEFQRISKRD